MAQSSTHTLNVQIAGDAGPLGVATQQGEHHLQALENTGTKVGSSLHATFSNVGARIGSSFKVGVSGLAAVGATAGAAAGGALIKGILGAMDVEEANAKLKAQLGLSEAESARLGSIAGKVYASNYGDSLGTVNDAIRNVVLNIDGLRGASKERLQGITGDVISVATAFDQDLGGVTRAVGQLMRTGLAKDSQEALNIVTKGFQTGADKADDFLDTLNEYGTQFRKLGIDGATATGIISQGLKAGARDGDLVADSIKEFSIRAVDGSDTTKQGFEALGLSAQKMGEQIGKGGGPARKGLDEVLDRLRKIKDPVKQSQTAVALFGTQAEDLGKALFALDPSKAAKGIGEIGGAARKVNNDLSTTKGGIETFKRQISLIADNVGKQFLPYINKAVTAVNGFIGQMQSGKGAGGRFADTVRQIAGTVSTAVGKVVDFGKKLRDSFSGGDKGASSSIQKIIGNVRQLVAIVVPYVKNLAGQIKTTFQGMSGDLTTIGRAWLKVQAVTGAVVVFIAKRILPIVGEAFKGTMQVIRGVVAVIAGLVSGDFKKAFSGFKDVVDGQLKAVKTVISGLGKLLGSAMVSLGKLMVRKMLEGLKALPGVLLDFIVKSIEASATAIPKLIAKALGGLGKAITEGIKKGFEALNPFGDGLGSGDGVGIPPAGNLPAFGGGLQGANAALGPVAGIGARFGLRVSSGRAGREGKLTSSGNISYHSTGEAVDEADGVPGPSAAKLGFFTYMKKVWGSRLAELIYTPGGAGIKNGRPFTYTGKVAADHFDHVHVALDLGRPGVGIGDGIGQAVQVAYDEGLRGEQLVDMVAIAGRESGFDAEAQNLVPPDHSIGFWQINQLAHKGRFGTDAQLKIPRTNAHAMATLLRARPNMMDWNHAGGPLGGTNVAAARAAVQRFLSGKGGGGSSGGGGGSAGGTATTPGGAFRQSQAAALKSHAAAVRAQGSLTGPGGGAYQNTLDEVALGLAENEGNTQKTVQLLFKEAVAQQNRLAKIKVVLKGKITAELRSRLTQEATTIVARLKEIAALMYDLSDGKSGVPSDSAAAGDAAAGEPPTAGDYIDASIAEAALTPGTDDDIAAATGAVGYWEGQLAAARASGDPRQVTQAAEGLRQARESLKALQDATEAISNLSEQLTSLTTEIKRQTDFAEAVKSTNEFQLTKTLADIISGHIVGRGVAGRAFTPGTGVEYAY